jgi:hypothetical protein
MTALDYKVKPSLNPSVLDIQERLYIVRIDHSAILEEAVHGDHLQ